MGRSAVAAFTEHDSATFLSCGQHTPDSNEAETGQAVFNPVGQRKQAGYVVRAPGDESADDSRGGRKERKVGAS